MAEDRHHVMKAFVNRLEKIGVKVELHGNIPWIYLHKVNDKPVQGKFMAEHGFTAFFLPVRVHTKTRFSDRRKVFAKVRETLCT